MTRKVGIGGYLRKPGAWDPDRLDSYARVWRLIDLAPDRVRREGAILGPDRFAAVVAAVDLYSDIKLPT